MKIRAVVASLLSIGALVTSINVSANEPIQPIKAAKVANADVVELGKMLFLIPVCQNQDSFHVTLAII